MSCWKFVFISLHFILCCILHLVFSDITDTFSVTFCVRKTIISIKWTTFKLKLNVHYLIIKSRNKKSEKRPNMLMLSSTCNCERVAKALHGEWGVASRSQRERGRERELSVECLGRRAACDTGFSDEILGIITSVLLAIVYHLYLFFFRPELRLGVSQMFGSPKEQKYQTGQYRCATFYSAGPLKGSQGSLTLFLDTYEIISTTS